MPKIEPDGPDAFAAVAHRLDALLQGKATADAVHGAIHDPAPATLNPPADNTSAGEIDLDLPPDTPGDACAATDHASVSTRPNNASEIGADLMSAMDNIDAILSGADTGTGAGDTAEAQAPSAVAANVADGDEIPDLDAPADSERLDAASSAGTAAAPAASALPETAADDPSANDLDAELAALLAESPIDPEVLGAAEEIAQRDAEQAEQNQEALRLRAEQAALALEQAEADNDQAAEGDITDEINQLLLAEDSQAAQPADTDDPPAADPSIDQIDQMLAAEAEDDIDLDGAFFSADDVLTDNLAASDEGLEDDELEGDFAASEDVEAPEPAQAPDGADAAGDATPAWQRLLTLADTAGLHLCWLLNWPARKFLSAEWRSTLGYVALLQAAGATAVWLLLVVL